MIRSTTLANIVHLIRVRHIDLIEIQDNDVGFPLPEAANTTMQKDYKCYATFGTGAQKRKKSPQGTYCTVQRVGCEKVVNPITMNGLPCLVSGLFLGLFLTRTASVPQGAQGCSPQCRVVN